MFRLDVKWSSPTPTPTLKRRLDLLGKNLAFKLVPGGRWLLQAVDGSHGRIAYHDLDSPDAPALGLIEPPNHDEQIYFGKIDLAVDDSKPLLTFDLAILLTLTVRPAT